MGLFSKKDKEREKEKAEEAARDSKVEASPPPSYQANDTADTTDVTFGLRDLDLSSKSKGSPTTSLPSNDECIVHLKFLTALSRLRQDVSETENLFELSDDLANDFNGTSTPRENVLVKIREKRWAVYVTRAVDRFTKWWEICVPTAASGTGATGALTVDDITTPNQFDMSQKPMAWNAETMPPLDVLMVLHSYMLNPWDFLEDCLRLCKVPVWKAGMPWAQIDECIDNTLFEYSASAVAVEDFQSRTGLSWENLDDHPTKVLTCYGCKKPIRGPYTEADFGRNIDAPFESARGFADKSFALTCPNCQFTTTHDNLRLMKFRADLEQLLKYNTPMPGTILNLKGVVQGMKTTDSFRDFNLPNFLIRSELKTNLLDLTDKDHIESKSFEHVRMEIEAAVQNPRVIRRMVITKKKNPWRERSLAPHERIAIRRMMSNYWENSSPFGLDLTGAVIRQGVFVDKMAKLDWIHSPALESTISRLIQKYKNFFQIMAENPGHMAVPTLDVDLAWHTHQSSPYYYYNYSVQMMKDEFIDHNDKIDENQLSSNFAWTSKKYQKLTNGQVYSECTCWYCEAIREQAFGGLISSGATSTAKKNALNLHDNPAVSPDPNANPHISAHNAVKAESKIASTIASAQRMRLQSDYEHARRRAMKAGKTPPSRNEYAYAYAWGYPMYMPVGFYPYAADPCVSGGGMYAYNPSCMNTSAGAAGNCCAGTCGGGASMGGCAGASMGGCAGAGASGGCAGGASGGACGGGGGGGGGCGGGGGA